MLTTTTANNGENTSQNKQLMQRKIIEGSPFYVVRQIMDNDKEKYFMIMGDYRLTEPTETEKETLEKLITEHWNIIANIVAITCEKMITQYKTYTKQQQDEIESILNGYTDGSYSAEETINKINQIN